MSATVRDISGEKLKAVAKYLDGFPPQAPGQKEEDVEQYYSLLCAELRRLPPPLGPKFTYTRSKVTLVAVCCSAARQAIVLVEVVIHGIAK